MVEFSLQHEAGRECGSCHVRNHTLDFFTEYIINSLEPMSLYVLFAVLKDFIGE